MVKPRDADSQDAHSRPISGAALSECLAELARGHGVQELYVFGSRAAEIASRARCPEESGNDLRSDEPAGSPEADVDIGVRPRPDVRFDLDERVALTLALEELLGVPRVDLVVLPDAGAFLALAVISGELLFCEDSTAQAEYELYVLRRAGDLLPFERERQELILRHGAR